MGRDEIFPALFHLGLDASTGCVHHTVEVSLVQRLKGELALLKFLQSGIEVLQLEVVGLGLKFILAKLIVVNA